MQHTTDLFDGSTPDLLGSLLTDKVAQQGYYLTYQGVSHLPTQEGARGVSPAVEEEAGEGRRQRLREIRRMGRSESFRPRLGQL